MGIGGNAGARWVDANGLRFGIRLDLALFELALNEIEQRCSRDENVVIIQARNRIINKKVTRLLISPTFDLEKREKELRDEIVARFDPKIVRMCGDGSKAED